MLKKFLATASVAGLIAGGASALEVIKTSTGDLANPAVLANELDFAGGDVETFTDEELQFAFYPTGGSFPSGNVLLRVEVSGAEFSEALSGDEVDLTGTSTISTGGSAGGNVATFLLSSVADCAYTPDDPDTVPDEEVAATCLVNLPLTLTGGTVTASVGLETDAGAPIDNSSLTDLETVTLAVTAPAFTVSVRASTTRTEATLASEYEDLAIDGILGDIAVGPTRVNFGTADAPDFEIVQSSLDGSPVDATDVQRITATVSGALTAFDPEETDGNFTIGALAVEVDAVAGTAVTTTIPFSPDPAALNRQTVTAVPDGGIAIERSPYTAEVVVAVAAASPLTTGTSVTRSLQSIGREGTEVTFPWTQTASQSAVSGATSVFRIGNLSSRPTGAVFAEVGNSSESGFTSSGIVKIADEIDANGEFVINSTDLEAAVGNYGRGDVTFIVESDDGSLTGRQFVVRNGNIQQVIGGTVAQDTNQNAVNAINSGVESLSDDIAAIVIP
jgi:hypothetical protein